MGFDMFPGSFAIRDLSRNLEGECLWSDGHSGWGEIGKWKWERRVGCLGLRSWLAGRRSTYLGMEPRGKLYGYLGCCYMDIYVVVIWCFGGLRCACVLVWL